jgi:hypothetical protein
MFIHNLVVFLLEHFRLFLGKLLHLFVLYFDFPDLFEILAVFTTIFKHTILLEAFVRDLLLQLLIKLIAHIDKSFAIFFRLRLRYLLCEVIFLFFVLIFKHLFHFNTIQFRLLFNLLINCIECTIFLDLELYFDYIQ